MGWWDLLHYAVVALAVGAWLMGRVMFWQRIDRPLRAHNAPPKYPLYGWRVRDAFEDCRELLNDHRSPKIVMRWWFAALALFIGSLTIW